MKNHYGLTRQEIESWAMLIGMAWGTAGAAAIVRIIYWAAHAL